MKTCVILTSQQVSWNIWQHLKTIQLIWNLDCWKIWYHVILTDHICFQDLFYYHHNRVKNFIVLVLCECNCISLQFSFMFVSQVNVFSTMHRLLNLRVYKSYNTMVKCKYCYVCVGVCVLLHLFSFITLLTVKK